MRGTVPKLYEYFGLIVLFYSNEHEPVHVHGMHQGHESKAELRVRNGSVVGIRFGDVKGRRPLTGTKMADFRRLVRQHANDIVQKWIEYFVLHQEVAPVVISRKLK